MDSEKLLGEMNSARFLKSDSKFVGLNNLIDNLGNNPNLFVENFKKIVRDLNNFLAENSINENVYEYVIHILKQVATVYYRFNPNPEPLVYKCYTCKKHFLENNEEFLSEEIHMGSNLKYVSYGFCSESCRNNMNRIDELERIIDNPK